MKRVLFLVAHPIEDAGCRYRVYQFLPYLENAGYECVVAPFSTANLFRALRRRGHFSSKILHTVYCSIRRFLQLAGVGQFDLVVIHREVFPFFAPALEKAVLRRSRKVMFSFDDAIYAGHHDVGTLNHPFLYRLKYGRGIDEILGRCVHVVAGNRILGDYARRVNPRVTVIPTVVDCNYYRYQEPQAKNDVRITVGWMGSRSTVSYLQFVESTLKGIARRYPGRVQFRFFGHPDYKPDLPASISLPFQLGSEIADLHSLDVGIMPMPDTDWTRGKCAFKAIQYMATGAVAVASPVGVTTDLIKHSYNGLLASSVDEWFQSLSTLVEDPELRRRLSLRARRTIEDSYSLQIWASSLVSVFDELTGESRSALNADRVLSS
jgi:glycosyltransferase involved in cell wall biosynthesis